MNNEKLSWPFFGLLIIFFSFVKPIWANPEYILPYPSAMPGSTFYNMHQVFQALQRYWYFGNLSQFTYHLNLADKYLVEAKTLFEYKQYLLAGKSLPKYIYHIRQASNFLGYARSEGKDVRQKQTMFISALAKHKEILTKIKNETPQSFYWQPEKDMPSTIEIHRLLDNALEVIVRCGG